MTQLFKCTNATFAETYYQGHELSELMPFNKVITLDNLDYDVARNIGSDNKINHGDNATAEATRNN